jgi:hypothetical protein
MVTREILNSHPISTLKKEISKTNIKGYSKMKKAEVVDLMMKNKDRFSHIQHAEKKQRVAKTKDVKPKAPKKKINVVSTKEGKSNLEALSKLIGGSDISKRVAKTKDVKPPKKEEGPKVLLIPKNTGFESTIEHFYARQLLTNNNIDNLKKKSKSEAIKSINEEIEKQRKSTTSSKQIKENRIERLSKLRDWVNKNYNKYLVANPTNIKDVLKNYLLSQYGESLLKKAKTKDVKQGATPDFTKDFGANLLKRLKEGNTYSKKDINSLLNYLLSKNFIKKSAIERLIKGDGSIDIDSTGYLEVVLIDKLLNYVRLYGKFPSSSVFNEELRNRKRNLDFIKKSREWRIKYKDMLDYDRPAPTIGDVRRRASNKEEEEWLKQKLRGQGRLKK